MFLFFMFQNGEDFRKIKERREIDKISKDVLN